VRVVAAVGDPQMGLSPAEGFELLRGIRAEVFGVGSNTRAKRLFQPASFIGLAGSARLGNRDEKPDQCFGVLQRQGADLSGGGTDHAVFVATEIAGDDCTGQWSGYRKSSPQRTRMRRWTWIGLRSTADAGG
jgi:hypothetical protein